MNNIKSMVNMFTYSQHFNALWNLTMKLLVIIIGYSVSGIFSDSCDNSINVSADEAKLQNSQEITKVASDGIFGVTTIDANNFYASYIDASQAIQINKYTKSSSGWTTTAIDFSHHASHSPALSIYNNKLTIVYRDNSTSGSDKALYIAQQDASKSDGWDGPNEIYKMSGGSDDDDEDSMKGKARAQSDHRPSITNYGGKLWIFDKNNTKHFIAECAYDGTSWASNSNQTIWRNSDDDKDAQQMDWGYQTNPAGHHSDNLYIRNQILSTGGFNPQTPRNPSTTNYNGQMYLAYKGGVYASDSDDEKMYMMSTSGNYSWSDPVQILSGYKSKFAPAITSIGSQLICVFSNHSDSDNLYQSVYSNGTWSTPISLISHGPHGSKGDPELTTLSNNQVILSYRDSDGKARLLTLDFN